MPTAHNSKSSTPFVPKEPVIHFDNVNIRYRIPREKIASIKEFTIRWLQRKIRYEDFLALRNVSFQIYAGEIFGVIGQNGAGKSTMLKVMARVLTPTSGRIISHGAVAPLLELGAGFHPELSGRENVYLNGALLGYTRQEIDNVFPWIVDFSELGNFIDAPIRTYSTGMQARLGFAVAISRRPQILLIDELLSVGDTRFQYKCLERINEFKKEGTTIVIVSHSMDTIQSYCSRTMWLDHGQVIQLGPTTDVIRSYQDMITGKNVRLDEELTNDVVTSRKRIDDNVFIDVDETHTAYPYLITAVESGFDITYEGGYFAPDDILSRAQLAIFALRAKWGPGYEPRAAKGDIFMDVRANEWLSAFIEDYYHYGLCMPSIGQKFWPEMGVNRSQAVFSFLKAILPGSYELPRPRGIFTDVPTEYWAAPWIESAVEFGIIQPYNESINKFYPEEPITRAEAVTFMVKALGLRNKKS